MGAYEDVHRAWQQLSADAHVGMTNAFHIVAAAANSDEGRRALGEILSRDQNVTRIDSDALSYLRVSRDLPLPPGVEDHRADSFFRTRFYTGTRISRTHAVVIPREFLYFDYTIAMVVGTLDDVAAVREQIRGSGYDLVTVRMPGGRARAIGTIMINEFRDTTFGPYKEVVFFVTAVPTDSRGSARTIDYVNGFSLQVPLDQGATTFHLKLWLDELNPTDGGNDFLGTNKELGAFKFEDTNDGRRIFRSWDGQLKSLVSGTVPRTATRQTAAAAMAAYRAAAERAGSTVPATASATIPVASRPDTDIGQPARRWAIDVDWRNPVLLEVNPGQVGITFGESPLARRFESLGFSPALSFYCQSGVGQIVARIGDCPFDPAR